MSLRKLPLLTLCAALCFGGVRAAHAAPLAGAPTDTAWEALVPKDWDPSKQFRDVNLNMMGDGDPRVLKLMRDMRAAWDSAPTNPQVDGTAVRLPGYVVPLDEVKGGLKEFLLVPYFGACIHTPPPPANQIVHVLVDKPMKGLRMMDAVWVSGTLKVQRQSSAMGTSGYAIQGAALERYTPPAKP